MSNNPNLLHPVGIARSTNQRDSVAHDGAVLDKGTLGQILIWWQLEHVQAQIAQQSERSYCLWYA